MYARLINPMIFVVITFSLIITSIHAAKNKGALVRQQEMLKDAENLARVRDVVHQELQKTNTPNPESFNVEFYECYASCFLGKTILIPRDVVGIIANREKNKQEYPVFQAAGDHEKIHLLENHQLKRYLLGLGTSVIFMQGLRKARFHNHDRKIMAGFAGALANFGLLRTLERHQERWADKGVRPDAAILRAKADFFAHRPHFLEPEKFPFSVFRRHPSDKERADSFNACAEKLEQEARCTKKN